MNDNTEKNQFVTSELLSKGYGIIPKTVMTDKRLTVEAKAIYAYLASYSGTGMVSYPSTDLMLDHLGMSVNRYLKHRKLLEEHGYLTIKRKKIDNLLSKNYYYLNNEPSRCIHFRDIDARHIENQYANSNSFKNNRKELSTSKKNEKEETEKNKKECKTNVYKEITDYLNDKAGRNFSYKNKSTQSQINGRMSEGRTVDDFKAVIDLKVEQWGNDDKMKNYLRPATLFAPTNFENYINEALTTASKKKSNLPSDAPSMKSFDLDEF